MKWVVLKVYMQVMKNACRVLAGKPEGKRPFETPGIDGRMTLKWLLKK
jgi:hypothetical protein